MNDEKVRLDAYLVRQGFARSRQLARELIDAGVVCVDGRIATKPSRLVDRSMQISAQRSEANDYVSRGALKLHGALADFDDIDVDGARCIDVGASTGGFTEVLLQKGAREVVAIDVGRDQLESRLRDDPRVLNIDRTHVLDVVIEEIGGSGDVVVADLSFISLRQVMGKLSELVGVGGVLLPMVKPQFEVGKNRLGKGGVVRDGGDRKDAVRAVTESAREYGLRLGGITRSKVPGPAGNIEYFLRLRFADPSFDFDDLWPQVVD